MTSLSDCLVETVVSGTHYDLRLAPPVTEGLSGFPRVFQVVNKEYEVIEAEGPHEIQARYYHDHYEKMKSQYVAEGLAGVLGLAEGPEEWNG